MAFEYIFMRLARRNLPKSIINFLLRRNWIISAGRETNNPKSAVECYKKELDLWSKNITDCVVLDFG
jgi:hypothetical protein